MIPCGPVRFPSFPCKTCTSMTPTARIDSLDLWRTVHYLYVIPYVINIYPHELECLNLRCAHKPRARSVLTSRQLPALIFLLPLMSDRLTRTRKLRFEPRKHSSLYAHSPYSHPCSLKLLLTMPCCSGGLSLDEIPLLAVPKFQHSILASSSFVGTVILISRKGTVADPDVRRLCLGPEVATDNCFEFAAHVQWLAIRFAHHHIHHRAGPGSRLKPQIVLPEACVRFNPPDLLPNT